MNPTKEDDASIDAATATTNVEPSSTTSATSSLFPAAVVAIGQNSRRDNVESLAAATARGNVEIIEDEDGPSVLPSFYSEWDGSGWTDSTAGWNLEIIEDEDGPRVPPSFSDQFDSEWEHFGKKAKARLEIIPDHTGPSLPPAMMEYADSKKMEPVLATSPCPFNVADIEDEKDALEKGWPPRRQIVREDSLAIPPNEYMEDDDLRFHTDRRGGRAEDYIVNANVAPSNDGERGDEDEEANVRNVNPEDALARTDLERDSTFRVPEAVLVEESINEVYMGEPIEPPLPWWKQRRTRILLSLMFIIVAISAITSGLSLSSEGAVTMVARTNVPSISTVPSSFPTLKSSQAPSTSAFPSVTPTGAPSVSIKPTSSPSDEPSSVPSSPPSACVAKIASNRQKIDLPIGDPQWPRAAVDGKNAVVVVQDGPNQKGNPSYVIFHSLKAIVGWMSGDIFLIDDLGNQDWYAVALSGKTAFVGFEGANDDGAVLVFEQDQFGNWEKVEDPFVHVSAASHDVFGWSVGIDRDLAFVGDYYNVYMFRRESNGKWVEFDRIDGRYRSLSISGDVIAAQNYDEGHIQLYKNIPDLDGVLPIQDPIPTGFVIDPPMDLSNDYMVYCDDWDEEDAFVYRREEANQTFAFHQQLNISGPWINSLAMDSDILVVGGINSTHIFSEQDGNWEETITLDKRYDYFALSGRQLLAATSTEVHAFDIQDCAQEMPTQTPSSSQMPTANPTTLPSTSPSSPPSIASSSSVAPSTSPSPSIAPSSSVSPSTSPSTSIAPSSSTSPTSCYWLSIAIDYDDKPEETYWFLYRAVGNGWETVKYHFASAGDTSYSESICLEEGEYHFIIWDDYDARDGICCDHGEGSYNVIVDGTLIVEGGDFGWSEDTEFSLPFVAGTNETTQYDKM